MIAGGCKCGAVRYALALDALPLVYCCHCLTCQSWSGSAFSENAPVPEAALSVNGPVIEYLFTNPSGSQSRQRFCATCHARIYNTNSARPGIAMLRAGTLDDSAMIEPRAHIWVKRKQPWVAIAPGAFRCSRKAPRRPSSPRS